VVGRHRLVRCRQLLQPASGLQGLEQHPPGPLRDLIIGRAVDAITRRSRGLAIGVHSGRCGRLAGTGQHLAKHADQPLGLGPIRLAQLLQPLLALLVDGGHALAEHAHHLIAGLDALLVQQADQQHDPLGVPAFAHVVDACHLRLPGEVRDLARRHAVKPHLGRPQRVQLQQVGQALLELAQRGRLGRGLDAVEITAPGSRVDQQKPVQPGASGPTGAGRDHRVEPAVDLGADRRGHRVQRGVAGQLAPRPHQLFQRNVDQIGRVVLGLHRLADRFLGHRPDLRRLVRHAQVLADELPVALRSAVGVGLGVHIPGQLDRGAHVVDHHGRDSVQLREVPQTLVGLEPHDQGQEVLIALGAAPRPRDLIGGGRELLGQLPSGHHPLEPRCRRSDRSTPTRPSSQITTTTGQP
jgi:hypothetical protein